MSSTYWQCVNCGALHVKDAEKRRSAELWVQRGEPVLGSDACRACGARHTAEDIFGGRRDPPQSDHFIAGILADPEAARWNAVAKVWTRRESLSVDAVVLFALNAATIVQYRETASPLQLAAVALAKTSKAPHDLHTDEDGLVVPGTRIKEDFPSWRVWLSETSDLWVTKQRLMHEVYENAEIPAGLARAACAGPVPAVPYLVGLCMSAGLDPNKLSPAELKRLDTRAAGRRA